MPPQTICKIIHLIPEDGIGGVEVAAHSAGSWQAQGIDFELFFIRKDKQGWPTGLWRTWRDLNRANPHVLILSLWRSVWFGLVYRLLRPRVKLVLFLHSTRDAHWLDRCGRVLALEICDAVWADSGATLSTRGKTVATKPCRTISFITPGWQRDNLATNTEIRFAFWGRLSPVKNLPLALQIFSHVLQSHPASRLDVIGPDEHGCAESLRALANTLGCAHAITWHGAGTPDVVREIGCRSHFYLQTSWHEGMAMSVVEAMQMGLIPVVTPVGEIAHYAQHMHNAIVIDSLEQAVSDVRHVLQTPTLLGMLQENSRATWISSPMYGESIRKACCDLQQRLTLSLADGVR